MAKTAFFTDEKTFWHSGGMQSLFLPVGGWVQPPNGAGHAESPDSKRRLLSLVQVSGLAQQLDFRSAPPATEEELRLVHPDSYLSTFKAMSDAGGGEIGESAPFGRGSYEIAKLSAGLTRSAMEAVLTGEVPNAFALSRPPGHHCLPDFPMGFCLLANIPVAIRAMREKHGLGRVAVIDWDVHHGNGTQTIFYEDPETLTISLHQEFCYPIGYSGAEDRGAGAGLGTNFNIPLQPGGGEDGYFHAFDRIVIPALRAFGPDLIVVASGLDANVVDPLARMQLYSESYRELTRRVTAEAADLCDGRLLVVHEGGYSEAYVPFCGLAILEELTGHRTEVVDPMVDWSRAWQPEPRFRAFQRGLIDELAESFGMPPAAG